MSKIIYPEKLKKGDVMALTAVSAPSDIERLDIAINTFKNLGFDVIETPNARMDNGIVSSSGKERAQELLEILRNPNVKYIIATRGGEFLMEMLPYLNEYKAVIENNPKWLQGFSDPSLLNIYITTMFNIATLHMVNINDYAMNPLDKALENSLDFLLTQNREYVQESFDKYQESELEGGCLNGYNLQKDNIYECDIDEVQFSGRIIGGCIDTFHLLAGTVLDNVSNFVAQFPEEGVIWYIDNCELNSFELYRRLWHMGELGYFKNIKGFLIGRSFMQLNDNDEFTFKSAVKRALDKYNVPIVYNVDIGHVQPQMYVVNGAYATFTYKAGKGTLEQKLI